MPDIRMNSKNVSYLKHLPGRNRLQPFHLCYVCPERVKFSKSTLLKPNLERETGTYIVINSARRKVY